MLIKVSDTNVVETDGLTADELDEVHVALRAAIDSIVVQIDEAKATALEHDEYADPQWWARSHYALRRKRAAEQKLRKLIARLRREERMKVAKSTRALAHYFMDICRERMDEHIFDLVYREAIDRKENEQAMMRQQHEDDD